MSSECEEEYQVPKRKDGSEKAFWYDRDHPNHIIHNTGEQTLKTICIGHAH